MASRDDMSTTQNGDRAQLSSRLATYMIVLLCAVVVPKGATALDVLLQVAVEGDQKPVVVGTTNLPSGTQLMISVSRKASSYSAQDQVVVNNGNFRAGPFTKNGSPLNSGAYLVEVSSPLAALQPAAVQAVIGSSGEKIVGPSVKGSPFGGKVISLVQRVIIGGAASPPNDAQARTVEREARHQWWLDSCKSNCDLAHGVALRQKASFDWKQCYAKCVGEEPTR